MHGLNIKLVVVEEVFVDVFNIVSPFVVEPELISRLQLLGKSVVHNYRGVLDVLQLEVRFLLLFIFE